MELDLPASSECFYLAGGLRAHWSGPTWWTDGDQLETVAREILLHVNSSALGREHQTACLPFALPLCLSVAQVLFLSLSLCLSVVH